MADLFEAKADGWDERPVPAQISRGVSAALDRTVELGPELTVMDFGAGTGLICAHVAPRVRRVLAVDVSPAMLARLRAKPALQGKVETVCQDLLEQPLDERVDLIVSAMAMHHVEDTDALLRTLRAHLRDGGRIALADLDTEPGDFHPPDTQGVYHHGFDRDALGAAIEAAGFRAPTFTTACDVSKEGRSYSVFLVTAHV